MSGHEHDQSGPAGGWDPAVCQRVREDAAVAVLTRQPLPPQIAAHAELCPPCAAEVGELTALEPLLRVARDVSTAPAQPSELMLPRLLREVSARRRRRRWVVAVAAAAAVGAAVPVGMAVERVGYPVVAVGTLSVTTASAGSRPAGSGASGSATSGPTGVRPTEVGPTGASVRPTGSSVTPPAAYSAGEGKDARTGAEMDVTVTGRAWGSTVLASVKDVPAGTECRLVVIDRAGAKVEAGSWTVPAAGNARYQTFAQTVLTRPQDVIAVQLVDNRTNRVMTQVRMVRV